MSSNFPLYQILYDKVQKDNKQITREDINKFINFVKLGDDSQSEIIYTIIRIYELKNNNKSSSQIYNIPYKGTVKQSESGRNEEDQKDISFDFNSFPLYLQKMLLHFMSLPV